MTIKLSTKGGGGGGTPLGGVAELMNGYPNKFTLSSGEVMLKEGVVETDPAEIHDSLLPYRALGLDHLSLDGLLGYNLVNGIAVDTGTAIMIPIASTGYCYRSTDGGHSFTIIVGAVTGGKLFSSTINKINNGRNPNTGTILYSYTYGDVIGRSTDDGLTWSNIATGAGATQMYAILWVSGDNWIMSARDASSPFIWHSSNDGLTWTKGVQMGSSSIGSMDIDRVNGVIIASNTSNTFVFRSTDGGLTWSQPILPVAASGVVYMMYAGNNGGKQTWILGGSVEGQNNISYDGGLTWARWYGDNNLASTSFLNMYGLVGDGEGTVYIAKSDLVATDGSSGTNVTAIWRSVDFAAHWDFVGYAEIQASTVCTLSMSYDKSALNYTSGTNGRISNFFRFIYGMSLPKLIDDVRGRTRYLRIK